MSDEGIEAVGVLGGTFDPIHNGHLRIAERTRDRLGLARVLLLPTATPPHKSVESLTSALHRLAMVELAVRERPGLEVCHLELTHDRCYTIDTLRRLRDGDPPCRPVFIVGMDALLQITSWREWESLLEEFDLAAVDRRDAELEQVRDELDSEIARRIVTIDAAAPVDTSLRPGSGGRIFHLCGPPIPISSSIIRSHAAVSGEIPDLVPPSVAGYIQRMGLYRREDVR